MILPSHGRYDYVPITRRADYDWPEGKRLAVYHAQTSVLIGYYSEWAAASQGTAPAAPRYRKVSGVGSVEEIRARVLEALSDGS